MSNPSAKVKNSKSKLKDFITKPVYKSSSGILSSIFQSLLRDKMNYNPEQPGEIGDFFGPWSQAMDNYITDSRNSIPQNKRMVSSARGNVQKEILNPRGISWKVFIKSLKFLGVVKFDISIVIHNSNGTKTVKQQTVNLGERVPYANKNASRFLLSNLGKDNDSRDE